jgi:hypothetical protein
MDIKEAEALIAQLRKELAELKGNQNEASQIPKVGEKQITNNDLNEQSKFEDEISAEELNDPQQPDYARLNQDHPNGRIIKMYNARFPRGGIF